MGKLPTSIVCLVSDLINVTQKEPQKTTTEHVKHPSSKNHNWIKSKNSIPVSFLRI